METNVCSNLPTQNKSICHEPEKKVEEAHIPKDAEITKNDAPLLAPITPDPNREVRDLSINSKSPPPTLVSSSPAQTPLKGVFDPFAPGPEKLLHAPYSRKFRSNPQVNALRRLKFDHCEADDEAAVALDDEILIETVYDTLLEAIVSKQREGVLDVCTDSEDGCKTPEASRRLTGIAETCPDAPVKLGRKSRNVDKSLCRKLEF